MILFQYLDFSSETWYEWCAFYHINYTFIFSNACKIFASEMLDKTQKFFVLTWRWRRWNLKILECKKEYTTMLAVKESLFVFFFTKSIKFFLLQIKTHNIKSRYKNKITFIQYPFNWTFTISIDIFHQAIINPTV